MILSGLLFLFSVSETSRDAVTIVFNSFLLSSHSHSFSAMSIVLNKTNYCDPLGQAANTSQQTAVGDLQWSTTQYCLQTHLVEKLDKTSCCFINFNIHRSAENFNRVLYADKPEDTFSIKIRICLGKTRIRVPLNKILKDFLIH